LAFQQFELQEDHFLMALPVNCEDEHNLTVALASNSATAAEDYDLMT